MIVMVTAMQRVLDSLLMILTHLPQNSKGTHDFQTKFCWSPGSYGHTGEEEETDGGDRHGRGGSWTAWQTPHNEATIQRMRMSEHLGNDQFSILKTDCISLQVSFIWT